MILLNTGSFNFNFDTNTKQAIRSVYPIIHGFDCYDCYIFMGAGFLAIVQGNIVSQTVASQVKFEGGAGYNLNLRITDPAFSGVKKVPLVIGDGEPSTLYLAYGLSLEVTLKSIDLTLGGSIQFSGAAVLSGGNMFYMEYGIIYANSRLRLLRETTGESRATKFDIIRPFSVTSISASATLTGNLDLSFGYQGTLTLESTVSVS